MKSYIYALLLSFILAPLPASNILKTVVTGEVITAADWNNEFLHIYADTTKTINGTWTFVKSGTPITITPDSAPTANTLLIDVEDTGNVDLWTVDYEGDQYWAGVNVVWEGATADAFETTLTLTDPTADRTVTFADATGTVTLGTGSNNEIAIWASGNEVEGDSSFTWDGTTFTLGPGANTIQIFASSGGQIIYEGATSDAFETIVKATDPTQDNTITFPDNTGTVWTGGGDMTHVGSTNTITQYIEDEAAAYINYAWKPTGAATDIDSVFILNPKGAGEVTLFLTSTLDTVSGLEINNDPAQNEVVFNQRDDDDFKFKVNGTDVLHILGQGVDKVHLPSVAVGGTVALQVDGSDNVFKASSSRRYKKDIRPLDPDAHWALDSLLPVTFEFKETPQTRIGLIAEDVHAAYPDLVVLDKDNIPASVQYDGIPMLLLQRIRYLEKRLEALEKSQ